MGGGKPLDPCWRWAKQNTGPDRDKFPWIDMWDKKHGKNATRFKLYLAFECPQFKEEQPAEHSKLLLGLSADNIKDCSKAAKAQWEAAKAACGRAATATPSAGVGDSHMPNAVVAAGPLAPAGPAAAGGASLAWLDLAPIGTTFDDDD